MHALARALLALLRRLGATLRLDEAARSIAIEGGRARAVHLASGETLRASAILFAGDSAALAAGLLGPEVVGAVPPLAPSARSLSAVTWSVVAAPGGFPLVRHNIFFSGDYPCEFGALRAGRLPEDPTIYICAQDRPAEDAPAPGGAERLLLIANAPAAGAALSCREIDRCETRSFERLARAGLSLGNLRMTRTVPADFERMFPGSGGAIYGRATHGPFASFRRPGARSAIRGLYLAGGSSHPGAGVPMVTLSGMHAADAILADRASMRSFHPVATPGGISTPNRPTAATA
jgi:1-hydroxycarotenoid 3,4-desaturase